MEIRSRVVERADERRVPRLRCRVPQPGRIRPDVGAVAERARIELHEHGAVCLDHRDHHPDREATRETVLERERRDDDSRISGRDEATDIERETRITGERAQRRLRLAEERNLARSEIVRAEQRAQWPRPVRAVAQRAIHRVDPRPCR